MKAIRLTIVEHDGPWKNHLALLITVDEDGVAEIVRERDPQVNRDRSICLRGFGIGGESVDLDLAVEAVER